MGREIRVTIADNEPIPRSALRLLIGTAPELVVVGESDLPTAIHQAKDKSADVALIHAASPNRTTLATVRAIAANTPVGVLTRQTHPAYVRSCLAAGARGYMLTTGAPAELFTALRLIVHGHRYVDASLHDMLLDVLAHSGKERIEVLSRRECQVLKMLAYGLTNQQIAAALSIGRKSVDTYRQRIGAKLDLKDRSEIVKYALSTGLLTTESPSWDDHFPAVSSSDTMG